MISKIIETFFAIFLKTFEDILENFWERIWEGEIEFGAIGLWTAPKGFK